MKVFRSRESRDAFSCHAASLVPTVDPGPGPKTALELELTLQEGLEVRSGSFSSCEGVQAGVQCALPWTYEQRYRNFLSSIMVGKSSKTCSNKDKNRRYFYRGPIIEFWDV